MPTPLSAALNNKVAIITGASRGIGAATAEEMASHGAKVVLLARSTSDIQRIANHLNTQNENTACAIACDVSDYASVSNAVEITLQHFGSIDILVNNAGIIDPIARLEDSDPAQWTNVVATNLNGVYHCIRAVLPRMRQQGSGTIINISSGAANNALEGWSHYCATKAGVLALTKCTHKEVGDAGIHVVGLSPGTVATEMQHQIKGSGINPVSQMDFSDHIPAAWPAKAIAWLCTDASLEFAGQDFSIKTPEGRKLVGLPPL